jgi:5-formyltetrahydrofolate cyclo-ligase
MKNKIRQNSLKLRKTLNTEASSKKIINKLFCLKEYKKSKNILCYFPLKYEIQTFECFKDNSKNWYLPRVSGENMEICPYSFNKMEIGSFNICEPTTEKIKNTNIIDCVIIPCVACDINGYRIGYGKGYYDRFFKELKHNPIKIMLIYSELLCKNIYPEKHDIKADIIITDKDILQIKC